MSTIDDALAAPAPTLAQLRRSRPRHGRTLVRAILVIALTELRDFFNVGKNITKAQMPLICDLIAERFADLKVEDIKVCFRRAMLREQLFDRLDGNIILRWLSDYEAERITLAVRLSEQRDACRLAAASAPAPDAVDFSTFLARTKEAAEAGDPDAVRTLRTIESLSAPRSARSSEGSFFAWFHTQWLPSQKKENSNDKKN